MDKFITYAIIRKREIALCKYLIKEEGEKTNDLLDIMHVNTDTMEYGACFEFGIKKYLILTKNESYEFALECIMKNKCNHIPFILDCSRDYQKINSFMQNIVDDHLQSLCNNDNKATIDALLSMLIDEDELLKELKNYNIPDIAEIIGSTIVSAYMYDDFIIYQFNENPFIDN